MAENPEVKVTLTAEDQGLSSALRELSSQLKSLKKQQEETASSSLKLSEAFKGLIAAISIDRFVEFGKEVFETGVNVARMMQMTGASAGTLSAAYYKASEELGIGTDVVDKAFVRLSKSIIEFQQGSSVAVKAFRQLGISAKDFNGLNTDQKIRLVTDRLGALKDGTEKAGLAQLIFSRSGAQALPVINALAKEGYAKATEEAKRFGIYLDNEGANSMLQLKQSLGDIEGETKGAALQFELGLIPALTQVVDAISAAGSGKAGGFKWLGQEAGKAIQAVAYGFTVTGARIAEVIAEIEVTWDAATSHMKTAARVFFDAATGNISDAIAAKKEWDASLAGKELHTQIQYIQQQYRDARDQANLDIFGGAAAPTLHLQQKNAPDETADQLTEMKVRQEAAADELAKARAETARQAGASELEVEKAGFAQKEAELKAHYDRAEISTAEYYAGRRTLAEQQNADETADLQKQIQQQQALEQRLRAEAAVNQRKGADASQTPEVRNAYLEEANRQTLAAQNAEKSIAELSGKVQQTEIETQTKMLSLNDEQANAERDRARKLAEFQEQQLEAQGRTFDAAKIRIDQEKKEYEQLGATKAQVDQFVARKTAQAKFEDTATQTQQGLKSFDVEKQSIAIDEKSGKIGRLEAEREINELIAARLPLLEKQAEAELAAAKATGNQENIAKAQNEIIAIQDMKEQTKSVADQVRGPLTQSFENFFDSVGKGTGTVARQLSALAANFLKPFQEALSKRLAENLTEKLLGGSSQQSGAAGGSGFSSLFLGLSGLFGGHAGGGLIRGRGTSTSDSIPARLSDGEYVVKASAVKSFGVHNLEAINRGMRFANGGYVNPPSFHAMRFAEGGMVAPPGQSSASVNMHVGLDEGLVLRHLSSKAAGRIVLNHLANNPKAAGKAISRAS